MSCYRLTVVFAVLSIASIAEVRECSANRYAIGTKGNVAVELMDGTLFVAGDKEANGVVVSQFESRILIGGIGSLEFVPWLPLEDGWSSRTTVNGGEPLFFESSDILKVVVVAGGGDDVILLRGHIEADVHIDCGDGLDEVYMPMSLTNWIENSVSGDLHINSGRDDDFVWLWGTVVGDTQVSTGHGRDTVELGDGSVFLGDVSMDMGLHADWLWASGNNLVAGNLGVTMGQGDDIVTGFGGLPLGPEFTVGGYAKFDGGQGIDWINSSSIVIDPSKLEIQNFEFP